MQLAALRNTLPVRSLGIQAVNTGAPVVLLGPTDDVRERRLCVPARRPCVPARRSCVPARPMTGIPTWIICLSYLNLIQSSIGDKPSFVKWPPSPPPLVFNPIKHNSSVVFAQSCGQFLIH